jgi:hypothetical protein
MVALTNALERIMNWLKEHQPEYAASFLPRLKSDEIQAVEKELGFKLPAEIYELYQWRNGTEEDAKALCFPTMHFLPLTAAFTYNPGWDEELLEEEVLVEESASYKRNPLFIFIQDNCDYCAIPLLDSQKEKLPVFLFGEAEIPDIFYTSLTDMMLTLAECYETGVYYLNEDGYICEDECKAASVLRKYNADIGERALLAFQSLLSQPLDSSNNKLLGQVAEATVVISRFKDPRGVDLLLEAAQNWSRVQGHCRDGVYSWVLQTLGEMCDVRALQPLTNALQDDSACIRKVAQDALSKPMRLKGVGRKKNSSRVFLVLLIFLVLFVLSIANWMKH